MSGLLRDDGPVPVPRDDEGTLQEIGTLEEKRMVLRDAGIEVDTLEERDEVRLCSCGLGGVGEKRGIAGCGRGWRGSNGGVELQVGVETLELENGKPWYRSR